MGALEPSLGASCRSPVTGVGNANRIKVLRANQAAEMSPDQGLSGIRAPMAQPSLLEVVDRQRLLGQGIGLQLRQAGAQIK